MENITTPLSPITEDARCESNAESYTWALYGCSVLIILVLTVLERRTDGDKCGRLGGHLGLVMPVNLLDHNKDRLSFAAAFGSMASACFGLFPLRSTTLEKAPAWSKTLLVMILVLATGLLYYPLFACLSTNWILVGYFLGAAFSASLFSFYILTEIQCSGTQNEIVAGQTIAIELPVLLCLSFLMVRLTWKFFYHAYLSAKQRNMLKKEERRLADSHNFAYVKNLLHSSNYSSSEGVNVDSKTQKLLSQGYLRYLWIRFSSIFYQNDPLFKYSPKIIATFVVSLICIYQISFIIVLIVILIFRELHAVSDNGTKQSIIVTIIGPGASILFLKVVIGSLLFSFVVSLLFTIWSSFQILTNYRTTMKRMFKGDFKALHFKRSDFKAWTIMRYSLAYAGSQIAYLLCGYAASCIFLTIICFLIAYLVILPLFGEIPFALFEYVVINFVPGLATILAFWVLLSLGSRFFTQKMEIVSETGQPTTAHVLALNNRKAYHIVSFFLFLFYVVVGLFGCFLTILKNVVLGILYLARLDRCRLMSGFESFDIAHLYFISSLYVEESHRHPVLLVFCDILVQKRKERENMKLHSVSSASSIAIVDSLSSIEALSTLPRARIRWHKAYTLVRNPSLVDDQENRFKEEALKGIIRNAYVV